MLGMLLRSTWLFLFSMWVDLAIDFPFLPEDAAPTLPWRAPYSR